MRILLNEGLLYEWFFSKLKLSGDFWWILNTGMFTTPWICWIYLYFVTFRMFSRCLLMLIVLGYLGLDKGRERRRWFTGQCELTSLEPGEDQEGAPLKIPDCRRGSSAYVIYLKRSLICVFCLIGHTLSHFLSVPVLLNRETDIRLINI